MASPERIATDKLISRELLAHGLLPGTQRGKVPAFRVTQPGGAKVCHIHVASWDIVENPDHEGSLPRVRAAFAQSGTRNIVILYTRPGLDGFLDGRSIAPIATEVATSLGNFCRVYYVGNPLADEAKAVRELRAMIRDVAPGAKPVETPAS